MWLTRRCRRDAAAGERGAVLMLVGIAVVAMLGVTALAVDMGHNYSESRRLQTATDAAALAAAQAYAAGDTGCDASALDFLQRNIADATLVDCQLHEQGDLQWVTVDSSLDVDQFFGPVIGVQDVTTTASSAAALSGGEGTGGVGPIRPMGLCWSSLLGYSEFSDWQGTDMSAASEEIKFWYTKETATNCGSAAGNWGIIDFDGGANSNADTMAWIEFGYPGLVNIGFYDGDPGALAGSHQAPLQTLVNSGEVFWLPIFTTVDGNGANAETYIADFVRVQITDFKVTGKASKRYLTIVVHPDSFDPNCCDTEPTTSSPQLVALDANGNPIGTSS